MSTETITLNETEQLLTSLPDTTSFYYHKRYGENVFRAACYWPDEVIHGKYCSGTGDTLAEAAVGMLAEVEAAKALDQVLKTPKAVKDAVIALMVEHNAQPTAFRAAVDDLKVANR